MKVATITLMVCTLLMGLLSPILAINSDIYLKLENDRLSADLDQVQLKEVIKKIVEEKGIWFKGSESLLEEKVSVQFTNLSLDNGLKRILSSMSYSLIFNYNRQLEGVIIIAQNRHHPGVLEEGAISKEPSGLSTSKKEQTGNKGPFKVIRNSPPPGNQTKATTEEVESFKIIRNTTPPGSPVKPSPEELDHFKVIKNLPPPGGPVKATGKELENFKVIRNSPPPGN